MGWGGGDTGVWRGEMSLLSQGELGEGKKPRPGHAHHHLTLWAGKVGKVEVRLTGKVWHPTDPLPSLALCIIRRPRRGRGGEFRRRVRDGTGVSAYRGRRSGPRSAGAVGASLGRRCRVLGAPQPRRQGNASLGIAYTVLNEQFVKLGKSPMQEIVRSAQPYFP